MELRRGGATGIGTMLLGGLNRLAEDLLPVQAYCCSACTKLEFYFSQ
ncbi:MAG: hypothetical protein M0Z66_07640 [Thermaerobacter sp.]|nr:hypothetical protein [Thermaerobacter sp.]